jgi:hypothetical protein
VIQRLKRLYQLFLGAPSRTRTDTVRILSPLPLPIGLWGRCTLRLGVILLVAQPFSAAILVRSRNEAITPPSFKMSVPVR